MNVISVFKLEAFWQIHARAKTSLERWHTVASSCEAQNLVELRQTFRSVDSVDSLTVFSVGGNNYRLIARVNYELQIIQVCYVLTHEEYDEGKWKRDVE